MCGSSQRSNPGIVIAAAAVVVMPVLARAKRRVAVGIGSNALHADSRQTAFCAYLSAISVGRIGVECCVGLVVADPVAGLIMVPIIVKGRHGRLKGKACCDDFGCR